MEIELVQMPEECRETHEKSSKSQKEKPDAGFGGRPFLGSLWKYTEFRGTRLYLVQQPGGIIKGHLP